MVAGDKTWIGLIVDGTETHERINMEGGKAGDAEMTTH